MNNDFSIPSANPKKIANIPCEPYFFLRGQLGISAIFDVTRQAFDALYRFAGDFLIADYNDCRLNGSLLQYCADFIYGLDISSFYYKKPSRSNGGAIDTFAIDTMEIDGMDYTIPPDTSNLKLTDSLLRQILTWRFYRDYGRQTPKDGSQEGLDGRYEFTVPWLKRRVARFLGDETAASNVSIQFQLPNKVIIYTYGLGDFKTITGLAALMNEPILNMPANYIFIYSGAISKELYDKQKGEPIKTPSEGILIPNA